MADNALVPITTPQGELQQIAPPNELNIFADDNLDGKYFTSISQADDAGKFAVLSCFDAKCATCDDWINRTFLAKDILVHTVDKVVESGEVIRLMRCVLIGVDPSQLVAWTGQGARKAIQRIGSVFGPPPWEKGLPLLFKAIQITPTRRTHTITVDNAQYVNLYGKEAPKEAEGRKPKAK